MYLMTNVRFAYQYRDASNYKQHGEAIFTNENHLPLEEIEKQIRSFLKDGEFFIARQVHLDERFFDILYDDDHPWHEFVGVESTTDPAFDPQSEHKRDITEFLSELESAHRIGWDEMNVREDLARQFEKQKHILKQKLETGIHLDQAMEINMKTVFQVRVHRDGRITLPRKLCDRIHIESGSELTLHDLGDGVIVMSPAQSRLSQIANQLAQEWQEKGVTLESMLSTLRKIRKENHTPKP